jgi:hypothetical protein
VGPPAGGENVARGSGPRGAVDRHGASGEWSTHIGDVEREVERAVVVKIWLGLLVVGVELLMLGWLVGTHTVDWLVSGLRLGP